MFVVSLYRSIRSQLNAYEVKINEIFFFIFKIIFFVLRQGNVIYFLKRDHVFLP